MDEESKVINSADTSMQQIKIENTQATKAFKQICA